MNEADMDQEKTVLEVIAPTVDEAITQGLSQLGMQREAVEVEILDAGSKGLFGLGNRQARVRLVVNVSGQEPQKVSLEEKLTPRSASFSKVPVTDAEHDLDVARTVVEDLLQRMQVSAKVSATFLETEEKGGEPVIMVDIRGDDLSILIGRKSETLNALQYIASLIIGKELGRWAPLMVDVQGYRLRRERQIRQLAHRMAEQAVNTGRKQVLEPMPANERRLVHMELRDHAQVITESVGDEPNRKVTIFIKK
jgi:spoIIIJ-associated protein